MGMQDYGGDSGGRDEDKKRVFDEFDCPDCDANNPYDEGFVAGDEVRCYYCGNLYKVMVNDSGKVTYKEA
jgi:hypothetical protein